MPRHLRSPADAIIRASATIFLPEVQAEARSWISPSLADTVETLALALSEGILDYGMGIYRPDGGQEDLNLNSVAVADRSP